jgi:hypothetical protein
MSDEILEGQHEHPEPEPGPRGRKGDKGEAGDSPTGDLLAAVRTLVDEVDKLSKRLSSNYPTKEEVQHEGRVRAFKTLVFGVMIIILANLFTIQTISYCFLNSAGTIHTSCKYIPGYENAIVTGNERLARFNLLLEQIATNQQDIINLQKRVTSLEKNPPKS